MLEQRSVAAIQLLQRIVSGSNLTHHVLIHLGPSYGRLRLQRHAQIVRQPGKTRA